MLSKIQKNEVKITVEMAAYCQKEPKYRPREFRQRKYILRKQYYNFHVE